MLIYKIDKFILSKFTHPQNVTSVEILIPQLVDKKEPDEKEYVDCHPDHLQVQPGDRISTSWCTVKL